MRTEYYYVNSAQDNYWLHKNLEAWSERLTGQGDWLNLYFTTREGVESFVRDVFADYCEDVVNPCGPDPKSFEYRYAQDGATVECDDGGWWNLTRRVERRQINQIRTRKEVVVDGETYSREVVEEQRSEWLPYQHSDRVALYTGTRTMYII